MKKYNQANQIETPHEYRYVGVNSMHKGTLSHQAKAMHCMYESLDGHLRGGDDSWSPMLGTQIPSNQSLVIPTFTNGTKILGVT